MLLMRMVTFFLSRDPQSKPPTSLPAFPLLSACSIARSSIHPSRHTPVPVDAHAQRADHNPPTAATPEEIIAFKKHRFGAILISSEEIVDLTAARRQSHH